MSEIKLTNRQIIDKGDGRRLLVSNTKASPHAMHPREILASDNLLRTPSGPANTAWRPMLRQGATRARSWGLPALASARRNLEESFASEGQELPSFNSARGAVTFGGCERLRVERGYTRSWNSIRDWCVALVESEEDRLESDCPER